MASSIGVGEDRATYTAGAMTDAAKEVNRRLKKIHYQAGETQFLRQLEDLTFSRAGLHVMWGHAEAGSWCWFDLREWVKELEMAKSRICHIRSRLVADGVIWYEALTERPGVGRIGWNLDFAQWRPLQEGYATWGGPRRGAGRPRRASQQADVDNLNSEQARVINLNIAEQASVDNLNKTDEQAAIAILNCPVQADVDDLNKNNSSAQRPYASHVFKRATPVCSGARQEAARDDPVRILDPEEERETDTIVSAPTADAASVAGEPAAVAPKQKRERRYSGEEQKYVRELVEDYRRRLKVATLRGEGQAREAAHWFFHAGPDGAPVPITDVMRLYDLMKAQPFWRGKFLSLQKVADYWPEYVNDPESFITPSSPRARAAPSSDTARVFRPASEYRLWPDQSRSGDNGPE